jgi:hypothetical protein
MSQPVLQKLQQHVAVFNIPVERRPLLHKPLYRLMLAGYGLSLAGILPKIRRSKHVFKFLQALVAFSQVKDNPEWIRFFFPKT